MFVLWLSDKILHFVLFIYTIEQKNCIEGHNAMTFSTSQPNGTDDGDFIH